MATQLKYGYLLGSLWCEAVVRVTPGGRPIDVSVPKVWVPEVPGVEWPTPENRTDKTRAYASDPVKAFDWLRRNGTRWS